MLNVYTDGSGKGKYGYVIMTEDNLETIDFDIVEEPGITNNQAEYKGILKALQDIFPERAVRIHSDSQLVINQLNHEWHIKNDDLRKLAMQIWELCKGRQVEFVWIPRKQNKAGKLLG